MSFEPNIGNEGGFNTFVTNIYGELFPSWIIKNLRDEYCHQTRKVCLKINNIGTFTVWKWRTLCSHIVIISSSVLLSGVFVYFVCFFQPPCCLHVLHWPHIILKKIRFLILSYITWYFCGNIHRIVFKPTEFFKIRGIFFLIVLKSTI